MISEPKPGQRIVPDQSLLDPAFMRFESVIRGHAERNPSAIVIATPGRAPLTYGELWSQLTETTKRLNAIGLGRNDRIAMVLPNGPEMAVAVLSVTSCATCAPLNPAYRLEEFDFFLSDLKASALIVQPGSGSAAATAAQKHSIAVIELTPAADGPAGRFSLHVTGGRSKRSDDVSRAEESALILHTSGSTSRPKRVALTNGQLLASAVNIAAGLQLTERDHCLNVMPLFHVHGLVGALLSSLVSGGSVVCAPCLEAEKFFVWLEEYRPTWYTAVPTIHQAIVSYAKTHTSMIEAHSLRFIRSCSAPLSAGIARELEGIFRVPVIEAYGMTEAAHQIASNPLPPGERKIGSVGLPTGPEVGVMGDCGRLLSSNEVGEFVIRGETVVGSYADEDNAHEQSFVDGWFKTGDQGYLDSEGYLYLTGRLTDIINRGGEKILPKEVEEVLLDHPEISQATVFPLPHSTLGQDVAAAVVLERASELTEASIREYLLGRMAQFKVPGTVFIVKEIPNGATGKTNRRELAKRFARSSSGKEVVQLNNDVEEAIAAIYREVLGAESVSPTDNFFEMGGDSLRATQVINRIRALFGVNLSVATIFGKPTVSEIAAELGESRPQNDESQPAISTASQYPYTGRDDSR